MGISLLSCIADLNESQNADQSLTSPLNFCNTSFRSRGFDGAMEGGGGGSCDAVEGVAEGHVKQLGEEHPHQ